MPIARSLLTPSLVLVATCGLAPVASAQCTVLARESFYLGDRPHGGNGRLRPAEIHDTLQDYWLQEPSDGRMWISSDQNGVPQWQFAGSSPDASEVDPIDPTNGIAWADATATALLPFTAPTQAFTTSATVVMALGSNTVVRLGYTHGNALWNNLDASGTLWLDLRGDGDWAVRTGAGVVVSGSAPFDGAMNGGFLHMEFSYDPGAGMVWGRVAGGTIPATPVTPTGAFTYLAIENQNGWGGVNNLLVSTGAGISAIASGPAEACSGDTAAFNVATNAAGPLAYVWRTSGGFTLNDGVQGDGSVISGTNSATLTISSSKPTSSNTYMCDVASLCGWTRSNAIALSVTNCCPADLDDGSGAGTRDGGVDINDLLYFLGSFENGTLAADLDDDGDPAAGTPDGGVDINDLLFFLARFEAGC